ncbi:hypothetical protein ACIBHX_14140 [Nonomuraea sp. NPDC050536]|uniref:hypothetical protein n=1 Tax=Nonomuraea sp. NPDC050536 TaxID=3364366 RepID=UPI0037C99462
MTPTVFTMAATAISRAGPTTALIASQTGTRRPGSRAGMATVLQANGGVVRTEDGLAVTGLEAERIGELAFAHGIALYELTPREASLEEAFMELTDDSREYVAR